MAERLVTLLGEENPVAGWLQVPALQRRRNRRDHAQGAAIATLLGGIVDAMGKLPDSAVATWLHLARQQALNDMLPVKASYASIAQAAGCSRRQAIRAVKALEAAGLLLVTRTSGGGSPRLTNTYRAIAQHGSFATGDMGVTGDTTAPSSNTSSTGLTSNTGFTVLLTKERVGTMSEQDKQGKAGIPIADAIGADAHEQENAKEQVTASVAPLAQVYSETLRGLGAAPNKAAAVVEFAQVLYGPEQAAAQYGRVAKLIKLHTAEGVCRALMAVMVHAPAGDVWAYVAKVLSGEGTSTGAAQRDPNSALKPGDKYRGVDVI